MFRGDPGPSWFYRVHSPLLHLSRNNPDKLDVTIATAISEDQIGRFDVVLLQRQFRHKVLAFGLKLQQAGARIVYELDDDLLHVPKWNPADKIFGKQTVRDGIEYFISQVDAMFVATNGLRSGYSGYCDNIHVLPNSIDFLTIFPAANPNTRLPVICWQGTRTHGRDVAIAKSGIARLAQDTDIILKMWSGFNLDSNEPEFDILGAETLPVVPFGGFYQMFGQVGTYIGLAPLSGEEFNKSKSNLKFLEYTAYNAVTVASDFGPYQESIEDGQTGILVSDNADWYDKVRMLLDDQSLYDRILKNAQELVREKYNIEKNYLLWEQALIDVLGR